MPEMHVASLGHSTIRLTTTDLSIVVDPGTMAPSSAFQDVDAFLVTHNHADHFDASRVAEALRSDSRLHVWAPADASEQLRSEGIPANQITTVTRSVEFAVGSLQVSALAGEHAPIYPTVPTSANVAYLVDSRILHPGDEYPELPNGTTLDALFLPISGPWMRLADALDYVNSTKPRLVIPIHDGDLNDGGRTLTDQVTASLLGDREYRRLPSDDSVAL